MKKFPTEKQQRVFSAIVEHFDRHWESPSQKEVAEKSWFLIGAINYYLCELEKLELVKRVDGKIKLMCM